MYRRLLLLLGLCLAAFTAGAHQTPIYRWVAPGGTVVYSDIPSNPHATQVQLDIPGGGSPATGSPAGSTAGSGGSAGPDVRKAAAAQGSGATLCQRWRKRVTLLQTHQQLYRKKPGGGEVKLTSRERQQRLQRAREQVAAICSRSAASGS